MALFGAMHTSGSGMRVFRTWLDAVSDNIANVNTVRPTDEEAFRARMVVAETVAEGDERGVRVAGIALGDAEGRVVYQPDHPFADEQGLVRLPNVDLGDQMVQLIVAQRAYQANLATFERARAAYEAALQIGG